ncbi:hypothetical protein yc1106_04280 [Curvularia clavata]|uniref:Uncharacterized protein n=1 Tax=Curvularia clavata TaxID=95742 RepID=A0A9Q8Z616_CURCL|nr:hypothetical protein yc1106_04280 [Curvularia clavata]
MAGANVIILYPRKEGSTFNKEYYINSHMPLCEKIWKKHGMKSWVLTELNADGPYLYSLVMDWESHEAFGKGMQDPGVKELMDDLKNYYTEPPVLVHGGVVGSA